MLEMLTRLAERLPSQTRRSEESEHFQQFSTPIALGFVAAEAAALTPADLVLEPSAGTGLLAIFAELAKARLALNEIADTRAGLLGRLFRDVAVTRHNAEQIHDRLDAGDPAERRADEPALLGLAACRGPLCRSRDPPCRARRSRGLPKADASSPSPATMSAPTSRPGATASSACRRKAASSSRRRSPARPMPATVRRIETRLTVIDRVPAEDPRAFPPSPGMAADAAELLDRVSRLVPPRAAGHRRPPPLPSPPAMFPAPRVAAAAESSAPQLALVKRPAPTPDVVELAYETREWTPADPRV